MKTTILSTLLPKLNKIDVTKYGLSILLMAVLSLCWTDSFAQKTLDHQELQQKLTNVNENIQKIDDAIATINARIAGIPPENLDPSIQTRLNDLQVKKEQYKREKISIEAALNTSQNTSRPSQVEDSSKSTFLSLPNQCQNHCLAHSDQCNVFENLI